MVSLPISGLIACPQNCSGNGVCLSGTCLCEVQFAGWSCRDRNLGYFISFGVLFYTITITAIIQLILCIRSDFKKLKNPSVYQACRVTIQKLIYFSIICASGSRAVYFTLELYDLLPPSWRENLFSTYYPFIMSGFSLIICFWAESFHLAGLQLDRPRFLTKSFVGFITFNVFVYVTLFAQVVSTNIIGFPQNMQLNEIFNGCFAFLMFFTLIFFLIYGVEIFCKVEGAFKPCEVSSLKQDNVNPVQVCQSRIGLISQATFQLAATLFLMSDVLGKLWKEKMSVSDRNIIEITFRLFELAVAIWFPCCLWNVYRPMDLWILNPQKLLIYTRSKPEADPLRPGSRTSYNTFDPDLVEEANDEELETSYECSICKDPDNLEGGSLIRACNCKGDIGVRHHECLKRWLIEKSVNGAIENGMRCEICNAKFNLSKEYKYACLPNGYQAKAWAQTAFVCLTMASIPVVAFFTWPKLPSNPIRFTMVGVALILEYILLRLLGFNFIQAYKTMRIKAMKILGKPVREVKELADPTSIATITRNNKHVSSASSNRTHISSLANPAAGRAGNPMVVQMPNVTS